MSQDKNQEATALPALGRRKFINTAALASLAGVAACTEKPSTAAAPATSAPASASAAHASNASVHLKPGELYTYYGL